MDILVFVMLCLFEILHKKLKKKLGQKKKKKQLEDNANAGRVNKKTKRKIITTLLGINSLQSKSRMNLTVADKKTARKFKISKKSIEAWILFTMYLALSA